MTDKEIIKALECCNQEDMCDQCPYDFACYDDKYKSILSKDALDLINRQQAEIDRYKGVIKILEMDVAAAEIRGAKDFGKYLIDKSIKGFLRADDIVDCCYDFTNVLPEEGTDI